MYLCTGKKHFPATVESLAAVAELADEALSHPQWPVHTLILGKGSN